MNGAQYDGGILQPNTAESQRGNICMLAQIALVIASYQNLLVRVERKNKKFWLGQGGFKNGGAALQFRGNC
jgi:hypothetical protein